MKDTYRIALAGMLLGLLVVANIMTIQVIPPYFVLSFVLTIAFCIGNAFGPLGGFSLCFLGDLIGCIIYPFGPYNILVGLSSGLMGLIFGFLHNKKIKIWYLICIFLIVTLICTSGINTLGLWLMYAASKKTFWAYLVARLPYQLINSAVNCLITTIMYKIIGSKYEQKISR